MEKKSLVKMLPPVKVKIFKVRSLLFTPLDGLPLFTRRVYVQVCYSKAVCFKNIFSEIKWGKGNPSSFNSR